MNSTSSGDQSIPGQVHLSIDNRQSCAWSNLILPAANFTNQPEIGQDELVQDPAKTSPRRCYSSSHAKLRQPVTSRMSGLLLNHTGKISKEKYTRRPIHPQPRRRGYGIRSLQSCRSRYDCKGRKRQLARQSIPERSQRSHARETSLTERKEFRRQNSVLQTDKLNQQF